MRKFIDQAALFIIISAAFAAAFVCICNTFVREAELRSAALDQYYQRGDGQ